MLRVATTDQPPWDEDGERKTQSAVRTLEERDGRLVQIGAVGGLGKGERIFAVRFIGDTGVRRHLPPDGSALHARPRRPAGARKLVGELKVPGYSAYLHPVGDGLLLGVGQRRRPRRARTRGVQVSLFDVSDLRNPVRLSQQTLADELVVSEVEEDHHAFLWWAPERLAVIPVDRVQRRTGEQRSAAPLAIPGRPRGRDPPGTRWRTRSSDGYAPPFRRSLVVGDRLVLVATTAWRRRPLAGPGPPAVRAVPATDRKFRSALRCRSP